MIKCRNSYNKTRNKNKSKEMSSLSRNASTENTKNTENTEVKKDSRKEKTNLDYAFESIEEENAVTFARLMMTLNFEDKQETFGSRLWSKTKDFDFTSDMISYLRKPHLAPKEKSVNIGIAYIAEAMEKNQYNKVIYQFSICSKKQMKLLLSLGDYSHDTRKGLKRGLMNKKIASFILDEYYEVFSKEEMKSVNFMETMKSLSNILAFNKNEEIFNMFFDKPEFKFMIYSEDLRSYARSSVFVIKRILHNNYHKGDNDHKLVRYCESIPALTMYLDYADEYTLCSTELANALKYLMENTEDPDMFFHLVGMEDCCHFQKIKKREIAMTSIYSNRLSFFCQKGDKENVQKILDLKVLKRIETGNWLVSILENGNIDIFYLLCNHLSLKQDQLSNTVEKIQKLKNIGSEQKKELIMKVVESAYRE